MTGNVWIHRSVGRPQRWWQFLLGLVGFIGTSVVLVFIPVLTLGWLIIEGGIFKLLHL